MSVKIKLLPYGTPFSAKYVGQTAQYPETPYCTPVTAYGAIECGKTH